MCGPTIPVGNLCSKALIGCSSSSSTVGVVTYQKQCYQPPQVPAACQPTRMHTSRALGVTHTQRDNPRWQPLAHSLSAAASGRRHTQWGHGNQKKAAAPYNNKHSHPQPASQPAWLAGTTSTPNKHSPTTCQLPSAIQPSPIYNPNYSHVNIHDACTPMRLLQGVCTQDCC